MWTWICRYGFEDNRDSSELKGETSDILEYSNKIRKAFKPVAEGGDSTMTSDHFTFPDDPEQKPRPGWGPFKFDWLLGWAQPFVEWHDKVTTINSNAQKLGIPVSKIDEYTRIQLETLADKPRNGFQKRMAWAVGFFLSKVNRFFYEGPLE